MTLLMLAGTGEARRIAWRLFDTKIDVVASLAGATRQPDPLPITTRIGGFGGEDGIRSYLAQAGITAVLDATHPFAHQITTRSARICAELGIPYANLLRPDWQAGEGDNWTSIVRPQDAANHVPKTATVFLATGRQTLAEYANLEGRRVLARMIDGPTEPFPFEGGEFIIARPPFKQRSEEALFRDLGVTHLIVKNAGGEGGRAKLDAARTLELPVLMLERPPPPDAQLLRSVDQAMAWLEAL